MHKNDSSFKNKIVLITGASSGIGEALSRVFAKEGASQALLARRLDRLQQLVTTCQQLGGKAVAIEADVTKENDLTNAVTQVHQTLGTIDVVIANAGFGVKGYTENLTLEDFKRQYETNVWGVLRTVYATLDDLKKSKGRLVIVGSVLGHVTLPEYAPYTMSKFALTALAETLFFELAPYGISVTLISPGFIKTEFRDINNMGVYEKNKNDSLPDWMRFSADKTAKIIAKAVRLRQRERIITGFGKLAVFVGRSFPGLLPRFFRTVVKKKFKTAIKS